MNGGSDPLSPSCCTLGPPPRPSLSPQGARAGGVLFPNCGAGAHPRAGRDQLLRLRSRVGGYGWGRRGGAGSRGSLPPGWEVSQYSANAAVPALCVLNESQTP